MQVREIGGSSNNTNPPELCVSGPASSAYVVAVGGTHMQLDEDLSFTERIWSGTEEVFDQTYHVASGGGFSQMFRDKINVTALNSQKREVHSEYLNGIYANTDLEETYTGKVGVPDISAVSTSNLKGYFLVLSGKPGQYPGGNKCRCSDVGSIICLIW